MRPEHSNTGKVRLTQQPTRTAGRLRPDREGVVYVWQGGSMRGRHKGRKGWQTAGGVSTMSKGLGTADRSLIPQRLLKMVGSSIYMSLPSRRLRSWCASWRAAVPPPRRSSPCGHRRPTPRSRPHSRCTQTRTAGSAKELITGQYCGPYKPVVNGT